MANAIIRLDNVSATKDGSLIKSVKLSTALQNGSVVAIGGLVSGEREVHSTSTPTATTTYYGILCTPELMYDEKKQMDEFINGTDKPGRAIILTRGDVLSATVEAFDKTPVVGNLIELEASNVLKVVTTATTGSTQVGKIIEVEVVGSKTFYVVEVQ
ncbi:hypothetical protein [Clostridium sp. 3-3]|uniref:hypothetical protein n=1 Tax=Clostridium sp. 3-3 TaxID=2070757 RepID=UPI000CDA88DA|nr:hypothetical protein [Clostridium sp. 3-3]POO87878.1 hypothetical protein C1H59_03685 [Clostridium sp. 3-3]